jgi:hypothetical protein
VNLCLGLGLTEGLQAALDGPNRLQLLSQVWSPDPAWGGVVPKVWSGVAWPMASAGTAVCDDSNWNNRGDRSHIARSAVTLRFSNSGVVTTSALVRRNPGRPVLAPTGDQGHFAVDDEQRGT